MLNPQQFFHGTRANLGVGDSILPSGKTGVEPVHEISSPNYVYMTQSHGDFEHTPVEAENKAWNWGRTGFGAEDSSGANARTWVGVVKPHGEVHDEGVESLARSATILERHDIMPGRQGTFPSINWNQFGGKYASGMNHPSDEDIMGGHDAYARKYRPGLFDSPEPDLNSPERRFEYDPQDPDPGQRVLF